MKIFNKCWRKLALIETCQKSICIDGRRRVVPGPCLGDMNVLRWPWGPTILILNHKARTFVVQPERFGPEYVGWAGLGRDDTHVGSNFMLRGEEA
jgi:hypothetical protein